MRAEPRIEIDVARLVELADESRRLGQGALHGGGIARIRAQIADAQRMSREKRRAAGQVDDDVAGRDRAIARRAEFQPGARRGRGLREIVDREFEGAEMSLRAAERPRLDA